MVAIGNDHELEDLRDSEDAGASASDGSEAKKPFSRPEAARDMLRAAEKSGNQDKFFSLDENPVLDTKPGKGTFWTNKNKKRAGIIGGILTGGSILTVFGFTSLAPLKIDSIVTRLEGVFGAGGDFATSRTLENMVNWYYTRDVLPGLQSGRCHSTISRNCVSLTSGDSLFDAWRKAIVQGHLESQLADKYGLEFGLKNGQYYMKTNVNGIAKTGTIPTEDFRAMLNGKVTIFSGGSQNRPGRRKGHTGRDARRHTRGIEGREPGGPRVFPVIYYSAPGTKDRIALVYDRLQRPRLLQRHNCHKEIGRESAAHPTSHRTGQQRICVRAPVRTCRRRPMFHRP